MMRVFVHARTHAPAKLPVACHIGRTEDGCTSLAMSNAPLEAAAAAAVWAASVNTIGAASATVTLRSVHFC